MNKVLYECLKSEWKISNHLKYQKYFEETLNIKKINIMGCHTWFYKKWNVNIDEAKTKLLKIIDENIKSTERLMCSPTEEDKEFLSEHPEYEDCDLMGEVEELEKLKSNIDNFSDDEIFEKFCEASLKVSRYVKGYGLFIYEDNMPHDLFRKYGYPDDTLHSLEETLAYIEDSKNECVVFEYTNEYLKKFWNEYPNGMIDFG